MLPDRMPPLRFALDIPQARDAALVARFCRRAEELGYVGLWCMENVGGARVQLTPLQLLPFAAAHTTTIRVGVAVLIVPRHNPVLLARELASIDQLSGGRVDAGFGLGVPAPKLASAGFPDDRPLRRLREGIEIVRALWTSKRADYDGQIWQLDEMPLEPKPLQQPHPPIWLGVGGPKGLRLTARFGDAWIGAGSSSTEQFLQRAATLREELAAAGRDVGAFPVAKRVYLSIGPSIDQARDALKPALDGMYGAPGLTERVAVYGPPDHCLEQLQRIVDGGAELLVLNTLHDPEGQLDAVTELAQQLAG
jgi:probable F420-dependent oxidoreductase